MSYMTQRWTSSAINLPVELFNEARDKPEDPKNTTLDMLVAAASLTEQLVRFASEAKDDTGMVERLLLHHQVLVPRALGLLERVVPPDMVLHPTIHLLISVGYYDRQHRCDQKDWNGAYQRFERLPPDSGLFEFYRLNYLFLSARNANKAKDALTLLAEQARAAAESLPEPFKFQVLGFITYNVGRWLAKSDKITALEWFRSAAQNRLTFYKATLASAEYGEADRFAARTQAWKVWKEVKDQYGDAFPTHFPITDEEGEAMEVAGVEKTRAVPK